MSLPQDAPSLTLLSTEAVVFDDNPLMATLLKGVLLFNEENHSPF